MRGMSERHWVYVWSGIVSLVTTLVVLALYRLLVQQVVVGGVAVLAAVVGAVATFGGVVTVLVGLFSLATVEARIRDHLAKAGAEVKDAVDVQLDAHSDALVRALSLYGEATSHPDPREAAALTERALQLLPALPIAAEQTGYRFARATFEWAWDQVDRDRLHRLHLGMYGPQEDPPQEKGDYRTEAMVWLSRAKGATEQLGSVTLALAKLYALIGDAGESHRHLCDALALAPDVRSEAQDDLALLLWSAGTDDEVNRVCEAVGYPALLRLNEAAAGEILAAAPGYMSPVLAVRKRGGIMFGVDGPSSPTVYSIGEKTIDGRRSYLLQWYPHRGAGFGEATVRLPREGEEEWDLPRLLSVVNEWFVTVGRHVR